MSTITLIRIFPLIAMCLSGAIAILIILALLKYLHSHHPVQHQSTDAPKTSLGEALKAIRIQHHMTQELLAERLGVSRQAVSKWENDTAEPSTANLCALARLYGLSVDELLSHVEFE